ncbi:MAG: IS3 family transposase [Cryobacterium sp.]|nr:IS3 family transposase [Oligoflexia bacterium]
MDLAREVIRRGKFKIARVCRVLSISRSNQYENRKPRPKRYKRRDGPVVLKSILDVTKDRGTYGYPRVSALINRERRLSDLTSWNKKRILRVMQINKLTLQKSASPLPKRPHLGQVITIKSNIRYCTDILEFKCWNGEKVFVAFSLDCHDRETMSYVAEKRPLFHGDIIRLIDQTVTHRFGEFIEKLPHEIQRLSDRGPQFMALQTVAYGSAWGFKMCNTPAYSPESNGMAEAFVKIFKRDYVYVNELWTAESVLRRLPEWFADYNRNHPHSGLKMKSPLEYREAVQSTEDLSV